MAAYVFGPLHVHIPSDSARPMTTAGLSHRPQPPDHPVTASLASVWSTICCTPPADPHSSLPWHLLFDGGITVTFT